MYIKLYEVLDSHLPWKWAVKPKPDFSYLYARATFKIESKDGETTHKVNVFFNHKRRPIYNYSLVDIMFELDGETEKVEGIDVDTLKIFGTVRDIIDEYYTEYVEKNPTPPDYITFSAKTEEKSRVSLYKKFLVLFKARMRKMYFYKKTTTDAVITTFFFVNKGSSVR